MQIVSAKKGCAGRTFRQRGGTEPAVAAEVCPFAGRHSIANSASKIAALLIDTLPIKITHNSSALIIGARSNRHSLCPFRAPIFKEVRH